MRNLFYQIFVVFGGLGLTIAQTAGALADHQVRIGDLKLTVPSDWSYSSEKPGLSGYLEAPDVSRNDYKRNIQIRSYKGGMYISKQSLEAFSEDLLKNFEKAGGSIRDYNLRNIELVKLASNATAGIIYSSFKINDFSLMHMHIVLSSANNHYVLTAADFEDLLDGNGDDDHLAGLWEILNTSVLSSAPENPASTLILAGSVLAAFLIFLGLFKIIRSRKESRHIAESEAGKEDREDPQPTAEAESPDSAPDLTEGSWELGVDGQTKEFSEDASEWNLEEEDVDRALEEKFG